MLALWVSVFATGAAAWAGPRPSEGVVPFVFESRDGTSLHASLWRAEGPIAGLLLIHGMQSHAGWFEISGTADDLARAGVTVLAYDRRGSGRSGGPRGHVPSPEAFLEDLDAARAELRRVLVDQGAPDAPLHALANCFGTRILLPYLLDHQGAFRSAVLTAPAAKMSRAADYGFGTKLRILFAGSERLFSTPLEDELFVSSGPFLEWIHDDSLSLREVTAGFLRATRQITRRMNRAVRSIDVPLLVVLGRRDAMVVNEKIRSDFVARYPGPVELLELNSEHYVEFTDQQPALAAAVIEWVRTRSIEREEP